MKLPIEDIHVYAKVVADLLHPGHIRFFKKARALGTHLTVCVVPDERVFAYKNRMPVFTLEERVEMVASCRWVDAVITDGPKVITKSFMDVQGFALYAFGALDDKEMASKLRDCPDLPENMRAVIPYTPGISSSAIYARIKKYGDT